MIYHLFEYLEQFDFPGAGMFQYLSFRASLTVITSLVISMIVGKRIIKMLHRKQIGESVRDLGLEGQSEKQGTPTMGGIIILASIIIPVLLFANLTNIYIILMLVATVWMGLIGFLDDYIKVFKKNKKGLRGKFKVVGQVGLGLIVGLTLYFSDDVMIRERIQITQENFNEYKTEEMQVDEAGNLYITQEHKDLLTTIPFVKNNEFDYSWLIWFSGKYADHLVWIIFVLAVIFIVTAVSNGANITDGLDGLTTGSAAIIGVTLGVLAWLSGNAIFSNYLNIMHIPQAGELVIFAGAFIGACIGFLWYNSYPAQVFMGDTGSLALGGIIAVFAVVIRKELLIPIICGVYLFESISVILQVGWFKRTKRKYGEGRRLFLMAPIHHHYQKKGYPEPKIVTRFWIVGIMLAVISIVTLKMR
ncbi:MAG: phospho-N-acetylmuramoyl-pentapeptide-transferase [Bacteroidetes bacterium]|nr:MAG: phospho-N-acetylmuramoyl-pentapeptide-transferase [Bacteroidota bacterium]RLD93470.1 MAG: phospho-N-acetylmuramoyl-pentapeptide-transferase [Bacteroidota bacterium]